MNLNLSLFSQGGSMSNLCSILLARYHFYPEVKTGGMRALPQLAVFTSEHVRTIKHFLCVDVTLQILSQALLLLQRHTSLHIELKGLLQSCCSSLTGSSGGSAQGPSEEIVRIIVVASVST